MGHVVTKKHSDVDNVNGEVTDFVCALVWHQTGAGRRRATLCPYLVVCCSRWVGVEGTGVFRKLFGVAACSRWVVSLVLQSHCAATLGLTLCWDGSL